MRCQTTYIIQGGLILSNGLAYSSPNLFVALLGFTAPPVELGVYLHYQKKNSLDKGVEAVQMIILWISCLYTALHQRNHP